MVCDYYLMCTENNLFLADLQINTFFKDQIDINSI